MPVAPLATVVRDRGRTLGSIRPPRQISDTIQGSSSPRLKILGSIPDVPAGFGARSCSPGRDQDNDGERGSRNSFRPRPWFLQLPVPSRKVFGRLETRNRPLAPERVRSSNTIQDGNTQLGSSCGQERRLPHLDRPQGRLLPDSSSPLLQKAPLFRLKRYGLPVQSSVFRVIDRPASVHKSFRGGLVLGSLSRSPPATIPGRLADPVLLGGQDKATRESTPRTLPLPRHSYKQEVRPLPIQVRRIPRHDHRHGISPSVPHRDSNPEIPLLSKEVLIPTEPPGPAVAGVVGTHVIAGEAGSPHKTPDAFTPMASEVQLVHRERSPTPSGTLVPAGGQGHLLVDGEGPPPRGDALQGKHPPPPRTPPILGRVSIGVGSPPPPSISVGTVVIPGDLAPHQHLRDESSVPGTSGLPGHDHRPASDSNVRQLLGSGLRQQARGDSFRLPLRVDRATSPLDGSRQRTPGSEVPPGTIERPRGSPQPPQPSTRYGVVPPPAGSEDDHLHLGVPDNRPIRNTPQCEAAPVLLPDSRPSSRLRRCLLPPVEPSQCVRVPTLPSGREGSGQSQRDPKSLHDSDRPPLAGEVLVRRPPPPSDPTSSGIASVGPPPTPTSLPSVPRRRPCPEPSRVETVKRLLRKSGLSRQASRQLSRCVRESTARLYQLQWLSFCGWCCGRSITPIDATIPMIVHFLIHLREDKGFSLSALKGYRSTINSVFTLKGMDLANSKELSMLFRSFAKTCSPLDLRPPAWDMALVLQSLTNQPYKPIREAEERFLAHKTLPDSPGLG